MPSVVKAEDIFRDCLNSKKSVSGREIRGGIPSLCCYEMRTSQRHSQYVSIFMRHSLVRPSPITPQLFPSQKGITTILQASKGYNQLHRNNAPFPKIA